jgi:hypothetical protein
LERVGLPEYGWQATGVLPQIGRVSLEPGGALVQVTYQFSLTQPMPGEPATVTLQIPAFYKATASGWVHAMLTEDLWGPERTQKGQHVLVLYHQLDAGIVEPMISHLDDLSARLCASLPCPSQVLLSLITRSVCGEVVSRDGLGIQSFASRFLWRMAWTMHAFGSSFLGWEMGQSR